MTVTLRPECAGPDSSDEPFLKRLVFETVAAELGAWAWPEPMRSHLLGIQYTSRRQSHRVNCPGSVSRIIEADAVPAGWLVVNTLPDEVHLVDILVLAEFRGFGIGTAAIREILQEAAESSKPVRLSVYRTNHAAIRLYERLGFRRAGGDQIREFMEFTNAEAQTLPLQTDCGS